MQCAEVSCIFSISSSLIFIFTGSLSANCFCRSLHIHATKQAKKFTHIQSSMLSDTFTVMNCSPMESMGNVTIYDRYIVPVLNQC